MTGRNSQAALIPKFRNSKHYEWYMTAGADALPLSWERGGPDLDWDAYDRAYQEAKNMPNAEICPTIDQSKFVTIKRPYWKIEAYMAIVWYDRRTKGRYEYAGPLGYGAKNLMKWPFPLPIDSTQLLTISDQRLQTVRKLLGTLPKEKITWGTHRWSQ